MEVFLECCMTLFFSAAMLLLIVRLAKGEEKNMMFARVFSLASNVGFWIGIVRIAVLNRSGFLYTGRMEQRCSVRRYAGSFSVSNKSS